MSWFIFDISDQDITIISIKSDVVFLFKSEFSDWVSINSEVDIWEFAFDGSALRNGEYIIFSLVNSV